MLKYFLCSGLVIANNLLLSILLRIILLVLFMCLKFHSLLPLFGTLILLILQLSFVVAITKIWLNFQSEALKLKSSQILDT